MSAIVVDASVVAAAFFQEQYAAEAEAALQQANLHAPDLLITEFCNVVWKRARRNELTPDDPAWLMARFGALSLKYDSTNHLAEMALDMAIRTGRTVYDSMYVALAVELGAAVLTADLRLVNGLRDTPLAAYVQWIGDWKKAV